MTGRPGEPQLVLSLFPGIGLLDMAFEQEGFCVVRGPDLLWGGDVRRFHPPAGRFDGVIGGPPCQAFSGLRHLAVSQGYAVAENRIPEFERCIAEAKSEWFVMENVEGSPIPSVEGYGVTSQLIRDLWVGGETLRLRRFSFGRRGGVNSLPVEQVALHAMDAHPTVVAGHGAALAQREKLGRDVTFAEMVEWQGLPEGFLEDAPFTAQGKRKVVGNGVPLPMGRAVAKAVKRALGLAEVTR